MDASWCAGLPKLRSQKAYEFQAIYVLPAEVKSGRPVCVLADDVYHQLPKVLWKQGLEVGLALQGIPPVEVPEMNIRSFFKACLEAADQSRKPIEEFYCHTGTWERVLTEQATAPIATTPIATTPLATTPIATTPIATTPIATTPLATTPIATSPQATTPPATTLPATAPMRITLPAREQTPTSAMPEVIHDATTVPSDCANRPRLNHEAAYYGGSLTRKQLARKRQQERRRKKMLPQSK